MQTYCNKNHFSHFLIPKNSRNVNFSLTQNLSHFKLKKFFPIKIITAVTFCIHFILTFNTFILNKKLRVN